MQRVGDSVSLLLVPCGTQGIFVFNMTHLTINIVKIFGWWKCDLMVIFLTLYCPEHSMPIRITYNVVHYTELSVLNCRTVDGKSAEMRKQWRREVSM